MQSKGSYKTRQGDELRSFLESVPGKHITAAALGKRRTPDRADTISAGAASPWAWRRSTGS